MHVYVYAMTTVDLKPYVNEFDAIDATDKNIISLVGAIFPTDEWIHDVFLDGNQIITLDGVIFPNNLTYISLTDNQIGSLAGVTFSSKLTSLLLSTNRIRSLAGVVFPPTLQFLDLSHNPLTTFDGVLPKEGLTILHLLCNTIDLTRANFPLSLMELSLDLNPLTHTIFNNPSIHNNYNNTDFAIYIDGVKYDKYTIRSVSYSHPVDKWDISQAVNTPPPPLSPSDGGYHDAPLEVDDDELTGAERDGYPGYGGKKSKSKSKRKSKRQSKRQSKSKSKRKRKSKRNKAVYSKN
jgi:hypothetical protein